MRINWKELYDQKREHGRQSALQVVMLIAVASACAGAPPGYGWFVFWCMAWLFCLVVCHAWSITGDLRMFMTLVDRLAFGRSTPKKADD